MPRTGSPPTATASEVAALIRAMKGLAGMAEADE
jgi:hypothetical protein